MNLAEQKCVPCTEGTPLLTRQEAGELARKIPVWALKEKALEREFKFRDFRQAIAFVNRIADVAEEQGHHPDICVSYNKVRLELSTHKIGGLSQNDFILAAKIDKLV